MHDIEFTAEVKFGDNRISTIKVKSLTFVELQSLWRKCTTSKKPEAALQRERLKKQAHFLTEDGTRVVPDDIQLGQLDLSVAKAILAKLDEGQGVAGEVLVEGDGATTPILYKLGTPIKMKQGDNKSADIEELEFIAKTYGQVEDVLAATDDMAATLQLLTTVASPVGSSLQTLPGWAVDKLTVADGVMVMRKVLPHF